MAIDDNTLYGLTGAQVKELPGKIEAIKGKAKVLTTDDYNWNRTTGTATTPNCVAVWRLPAGIYTGHTVDVTAYPSAGASAIHPSLIIVAESYTGEQTPIIYKAFSGNWYIGNASDSTAAYQTLLTSSNIVNNLTSTSTTSALSANQGKVLKDLIGDLTNLTTTDKTNLVAAINEAAAGGGGGGVIELTSADYNYPTDNPTQIAAWLLPDGIYHSASTAIQWSAYGDSAVNGTFIKTTNSSNIAFVFFYRESGLNEVILTQALGSTHYTNLSTSAVKQTTGTSTTDVMSQNAVTGMIYNGGNATKVQIGANSAASQNWGVAILGVTSQENTIAIGNAASATAKGAIALGVGSNASTQGVFDVGLSNTSSSIQSANGYNGSAYRLLTGLYDPQNAHDAATKGYVDTAVAGAGAATFTTNEWNALWA